MSGAEKPARKPPWERLRARQEIQLAAAVRRADRPMAATWWALLGARGLLPAAFSWKAIPVHS